jgi:hypothetical protein
MSNEFEKCGKWLLEAHRDGWVVCHGIVVGKHKEDVYQHCWLELPESNKALLLSTGKPILVNADEYRHANSAFTIDEFQPHQVKALVSKFKHYGPYDRDLQEMPRRILH